MYINFLSTFQSFLYGNFVIKYILSDKNPYHIVYGMSREAPSTIIGDIAEAAQRPNTNKQRQRSGFSK